MDFELWLNKIADFLVAAGVPAEDGPMAGCENGKLLLRGPLASGRRLVVHGKGVVQIPVLAPQLGVEQFVALVGWTWAPCRARIGQGLVELLHD